MIFINEEFYYMYNLIEFKKFYMYMLLLLTLVVK